MKEIIPVKRALISVSNKTGIFELASGLLDEKIEIISTGNTAKKLKEQGINSIEISEVTNFPEILDGRVKTLHPYIYGGLLSIKDKLSHESELDKHDIKKIDLVIVNLYPFEDSISKNLSLVECIENIDIGGPSIIRAAAKNYDRVGVVVDNSDYKMIIDEIKKLSGLTYNTRMKLAAKAFERIKDYDTHISNWFFNKVGSNKKNKLNISAHYKSKLRYGENPHQRAEVYSFDETKSNLLNSKILQGKELSFNNYKDVNSALKLIKEFQKPTVVIIKHNNPCGVAESDNLLKSWQLALKCDPISAFGGIVALNQNLDKELALKLKDIFLEVVVAPRIDFEAQLIFKNKKNIRLIEIGNLPEYNIPEREIVNISGGLLIQDKDRSFLRKKDLKIVSKREPNAKELKDLIFAFKVVKHAKSNAIVFAKDGSTTGIGAGNTSRVDSVEFAALKANRVAKDLENKISPTIGSVLASDAFFPFSDGVIKAAEYGATAIIQPGGSRNDEEVIKEVNDRKLAMVFTGVRCFSH